MKKPTLYKTPLIVAWVLLAIGLAGAFNLAYMPLLVEGYDGMSGGFAFMLIGGFVAMTALITFAVYGKLNREFRQMLSGQVLLRFDLPRDLYTYFNQQETENVRRGNKAVLLTILGFCVLFALVLGLAVDPLFFIICFAIAVFFTVVYFLATAFRTGKLKKIKPLTMLSMGGAYLNGELHSWSLPGSRLLSAQYFDGLQEGLSCPVLQLVYLVPNRPVAQECTVTIPIPPELASQAQWAAGMLK